MISDAQDWVHDVWAFPTACLHMHLCVLKLGCLIVTVCQPIRSHYDAIPLAHWLYTPRSVLVANGIGPPALLVHIVLDMVTVLGNY